MDVKIRFTQAVISLMQKDISEADGNEVFWAGTINAEGKVISVKVGSRGNSDSVVINRDIAKEGHVLIHNHPSGFLEPSEADQRVAMSVTDCSVGFYIVNNDVSDVYVVVEPVKPKSIHKVDEEKAAYYLSNNGPLAQKSSDYEERPCQIELVKSVARTFNENKIGVFEAGTGVGKSYAYLIPSMLWAVQNKERVVISTGTINLQQQLVEKDIPAAQKILGINLKSILLKGRQNYLCLRRLAETGNERDLFSDEEDSFDKIAEWAKVSESGSKSDLSFVPPESLWVKINSESDACMGMRCPYRESCFVMRLRKEASDANIIVVNHHLLFADIESRVNGSGYDDTAVLPPYRRIVFDEAHGIEDSATSFFSETLTRFKLMKQINLLYRTWKGSFGGFLVQVSAVVKSEDFLQKVSASVDAIKASVVALDVVAQEEIGNEYSCRIREENAGTFSQVFTRMLQLRKDLGAFTSLVRGCIEELDEDDKELASVWETKTVLRRLEQYVNYCKSFCEWNEHDDLVFWMQKLRMPAKRAGEESLEYVQFVQTPLDVAPLMNMGVFEPMSSVVCTSATLRTGADFRYWMRRTGISFVEQERVLQQVFESPFPYKKNVIFGVPSDACYPDSEYYQGYIEETIPNLILASKGRTLVLFTSYDSLKHAYNSTKITLLNAGINILKQGDDDRFRLLEQFRNDNSSVLYATDSFWEGVDVPGQSLSQVIIVKLPFAVPNDPVFAARSEAVEKRGGSAFMELSVPQAVIKFRQGFGRLVRRGDDRGVIIVLDRRIVEKRYGKQFTTSVPMSRRMYNPLQFILTEMEKFFLVE